MLLLIGPDLLTRQVLLSDQQVTCHVQAHVPSYSFKMLFQSADPAKLDV